MSDRLKIIREAHQADEKFLRGRWEKMNQAEREAHANAIWAKLASFEGEGGKPKDSPLFKLLALLGKSEKPPLGEPPKFEEREPEKAEK